MSEPAFTVVYSVTAGLYLNCSECGTVADYPDESGAAGTAADFAELADDARAHAQEHSEGHE